MPIGSSADAVLASRRTREIAGLLDLAPQQQTRLGGAVAEVVEGALEAGSTGTLEFAVEDAPDERRLVVTLRGVEPHALGDAADAIELDRVRALVSQVDVRADGSTARICLAWDLPSDGFLPPLADMVRAVHGVAGGDAAASVDELRRRNVELVQTLTTLQTREAELLELNRALADTNAGIVGLLGELDQSVDALRRADEPKTQFLRTVSHELRTPLYAARGLLEELTLYGLEDAARADVELLDGTVTEALTIINDQLDLLRLQAGSEIVRIGDVDVHVLLQGMRGTLRVLRRGPEVELVVDAPPGLPVLHTDGGKLSQILRNLISNALKFTAAGEVRVTATQHGDTVAFVVRDTGIGLGPEHLDLIFEEFGQVRGDQLDGISSTGLGLPLARSLAQLLGGTVTVTSVLGEGSAFTATIPIHFQPASGVMDRGSAA